MLKAYKLLIVLLLASNSLVQAQHLFEHTYPDVQQEDSRIRQLMNQVSKDSLEATINHLQSYHTRCWNSRMVYEVQDWLFQNYVDMKIDSVVLHDFLAPWHDSLYETSDNVIAVQLGTRHPEEFVVCGAHYDSFNKNEGHPDSLRAPGADDNASGVSGILETARLLSRCKFERSIIYGNWAAEEIGLHGSFAYAKDCAEKLMDIVGYFNLDMIGYLEDGYDIHVNLLYRTRDSIIADYVYSFSNTYYPEMRIYQSWLTNGDSDYSAFNRNGYAAVHTFENTHHSSPYIHTPDDLLGVSVNNMDQVKRFTELNVGLVATLAGLVSNSIDEEEHMGLEVFPNPSEDQIMLRGIPMREITVYDLLGRQVIKETCHGSATQLDIASLAAGVYVLRVLDDAMNVHSHRVVKF